MKRKVRKKRPVSGWTEIFLKITQHLSACVAVLALAGLFLSATIYVDEMGSRCWINSGVRDGQTAGSYIISNLSNETENAIRFAIIRSQMETEGEFDLKREINISEYYYRKDNYFYNTTQQRTYFSDAVYYLEDLIRWQQAGGIQIQQQGNARAVSRFVTIDGKRLEELVRSDAELKTLLEQLDACMNDLYDNYTEYKSFTKRYSEGSTSFVYYIDLDNGTGDVYTNASQLQHVGSAKAQEYFSELECAAVGTTALNYNIRGDYEISSEYVTDFMSRYAYAMGDNAVVYTGFDMSLGVNDYYATLWNAFDSYDAEQVYILVGMIVMCALYYFLVTMYLISAAGRKADQNGEEYIQLQWTDSAYLELFVGWCCCLVFGIIFGYFELEWHYRSCRENLIPQTEAIFITVITMTASVLFIESVCSLARRIKSGTFLKNSLTYKLCISKLVLVWKRCSRKVRAYKKRMQHYAEHTGLWQKTWGAFFCEVVFFGGCLFAMYLYPERGVILFLAAVMLLVLVLTSYRRLTRKVERVEIVEKMESIVEGDSSRVDVEHLSAENTPLGRAVNEIGDGIQQAVEKSVKDERLKAELLTNVSHDIKTPLTSIISYVDLLKKEQIDNPKAAEYIDILENKSLKLKNLIQDLIEVSKISTGNIEYEMMPINLHELVLQAAAEYDEKFAEHCLKLIYNNDAKEACILADPRRMWRVMENLLSNVYKYALEGTRVYLDVTTKDNKLICTMKNISAKELNIQAEELTERFVRGDSSRTTDGSGLGLAIAENLVIGQGGTMQIMLDGDLFKVQLIFKLYEKEI